MKTAFLFPGQGSQAKGMGKFVWENYPKTQEFWSQWSREIGFDLAHLCLEMSDAELALTANTQPAIVAVSIILDLMLKERGLVPQSVAGHSVGEYAALAVSYTHS
ncbi:MAG: acyltransferase domain-containing protein, partial [Bdellovibrionaceae bacterium]|nr:acyltransferase domain-containing protein [Pseudobdellovibrionaceae bacterium]